MLGLTHVAKVTPWQAKINKMCHLEKCCGFADNKIGIIIWGALLNHIGDFCTLHRLRAYSIIKLVEQTRYFQSAYDYLNVLLMVVVILMPFIYGYFWLLSYSLVKAIYEKNQIAAVQSPVPEIQMERKE